MYAQRPKESLTYMYPSQMSSKCKAPQIFGPTLITAWETFLGDAHSPGSNQVHICNTASSFDFRGCWETQTQMETATVVQRHAAAIQLWSSDKTNLRQGRFHTKLTISVFFLPVNVRIQFCFLVRFPSMINVRNTIWINWTEKRPSVCFCHGLHKQLRLK